MPKPMISLRVDEDTLAALDAAAAAASMSRTGYLIDRGLAPADEVLQLRSQLARASAEQESLTAEVGRLRADLRRAARQLAKLADETANSATR